MSTRRMRVVLAAATVVVAVVAGVLGAAPAAGAADLPVSGSLTASGNFESTPECPSFHTWHDGGGDWTGLGTTTFHLDYCVDLQPEVATSPLVGTFTIDADGGTLTGDVTGEVANNSDPEGRFPVRYDLTITGGTGAYERATGSLAIDAVWNHRVIPVWLMEGPVSGTLELPPPMPTSKRDCKRGGWRHLGDHHGNPFRSQGHCIAWVQHHL